MAISKRVETSHRTSCRGIIQGTTSQSHQNSHFKHASPAGAAVAVPLTPKEREAYEVEGEFTPLSVAYLRARNADPMSSFGDFSAVR